MSRAVLTVVCWYALAKWAVCRILSQHDHRTVLFSNWLRRGTAAARSLSVIEYWEDALSGGPMRPMQSRHSGGHHAATHTTPPVLAHFCLGWICARAGHD